MQQMVGWIKMIKMQKAESNVHLQHGSTTWENLNMPYKILLLKNVNKTLNSLARVTPQVFQRCLLHILQLLPSQLGLEAMKVVQQLKDVFPTCLKTVVLKLLANVDGSLSSQAEQGQCNMQYAKFEHFPYVPSWDPM
ncbi:hypothetical protein BGW80DRAFT_1247049 [Lactifluus volemus]|nr:hypothetical protein BGW80DRAFT_1247049 [Lactifluus volemus]